jgi:NADPH:quinone reductase-like Zn-dependent oxidoreductase
MKAIVYHNYGSADVLKYEELEKPTPGNSEVMVKVRAASLNALDWRMMLGKPVLMRLMLGGLRKPKQTRPGVDLAGQVEAVGREVTKFKPGDEVFGVGRGALAEYVCTVEDKLALKPPDVTFEDAAAMPVAAVTALQGLRDKGRIQPGQKVLIDGASGGVGTFAIQLAKSFGAEVTAVCSTAKLDTARSIGADHVIDYTREDFTQSGQGYDLIFAANAYHSIFAYRRALSENGIYVMAGAGDWILIIQTMVLAQLLTLVGRRKFYFFMAKMNTKDLTILGDLLAAGKIASVIDKRYPLTEAREAFRYLEQKHARGKLVVTVQP